MRGIRTLLLLVVLGTGMAWAAARQPPRGDDGMRAVLTDTEAWLQAGVEMIAGPRVTGIKPSPDGRYLLAERESLDPTAAAKALSGGPPAGGTLGEKSLVLWNGRTRRSSVVWRQPLGGEFPPAVEQIEWLPGTDIGLAVTRNAPPQPVRTLLLLNASQASLRPLAALETQDRLFVSPVRPVAVLYRPGEAVPGADGTRALGPASVRILRSNGGVGAPLALPTSDATPESWAPDGNALYVRGFEHVEQPKPGLLPRWWALALRSGTLTPLDEAPRQVADNGGPGQAPAVPPAERLPVRLRQTTGSVKEDTTVQALRPVWLESVAPSEAPRALLAPDAENAFLLPDASAVLYQSRGALYAVPLVRVNKAAFLEARRRAQRTAAMSNARQIGLALMMYAQDYDEFFPPAGADTVNQVLPYIKNEAVFHDPSTGAPGFAYTFGGGSLAGIKEPASTIIGYVTGPGGRADIYADGHVKWRDDP